MSVLDAELPAMVPPVAKMTILGRDLRTSRVSLDVARGASRCTEPNSRVDGGRVGHIEDGRVDDDLRYPAGGRLSTRLEGDVRKSERRSGDEEGSSGDEGGSEAHGEVE